MSEWRKSKKKKEANIGFDNAVKYLLIKLLFFSGKIVSENRFSQTKWSK